MAELVLMQKGEATMNVPAAKVPAYLEDGWREVSRFAVEESAAPAVVEVPAEKADEPAPKGKPKAKGN